ncbi:hypothetical protein IAT38_007091 [Cryptococcus sp. DSM 104549]
MDGIHLAAHINNPDPLPGGFQAGGFAALMAICNHYIANKLFSIAYNTVTTPFTVTVNFVNSYSGFFTPSSASAVTPSLDPAPVLYIAPFLSGYTHLPRDEMYSLALVHSGPTSLFWQSPAEHVEAIQWQIMVDEEKAALQAWMDEQKRISELGIGYDDFDAETDALPEPSLADCILEMVDGAPDIIYAFGALISRHLGKILAAVLPALATHLMWDHLCWTFGYLWPQAVCFWSEFGGTAITSVAVLAAIGILHEVWDFLVIARYGMAALRLGTATLAWASDAIHTAVKAILICAVAFTLIFLAVVALLSCASRIDWYDPHWSSPVVVASPSPTSTNPPSTTTKAPPPDGGSTSVSAIHAVTSRSKARRLPRKTCTYRAPSMDSDSEDEDISSANSESDGGDCGSGARVMVDKQTSTSASRTKILSDDQLKKRKEALRAVALGSLDDDDDYDTPASITLETKVVAQEPAPEAQEADDEEQKALAVKLEFWDGMCEAFANEQAPSQAPVSPSTPSTTSPDTSSTTSSSPQMPAPTTPAASFATPAAEETREQGRGQEKKSDFVNISISPSKVVLKLLEHYLADGTDAMVTEALFDGLERLILAQQADNIVGGASIEEIVEEVIAEEEIQEEGVDEEEAQAPAPFEYPFEAAAVKPRLLILPAPEAPILEVIVRQPIVEKKEGDVVVQVQPAETPEQTTPAAAAENVALPIVAALDAATEALVANENLAKPLEEFIDEPVPAAAPAIAAVTSKAIPLPESPTQGPAELVDEVEPVAAVETGENAGEIPPVQFQVEENVVDVAAEDEEDYVLVPNVADIMAAMGPEDDGEAIEDEEAEIARTTAPTPTLAPTAASATATTSTTASAPSPTAGPYGMRRPNTWEEILLEFPHVPLKYEGINLETCYTDEAQKKDRVSLRRWVANAMRKRAKEERSAASASAAAPAAPSTSDPTPTPAPSATTAKPTTSTPKIETSSDTYAGQEFLPLPTAFSTSPTSPTSTAASTRSPTSSGRMAADQLFSDSDDGGWETVFAGKRCVRVSPAAGAGKSKGGFGAKSFFAALDERSTASEASDEERSEAGAVEVETAKPGFEVDAEHDAEFEADVNPEAEIEAATELKTSIDDVKPTPADVPTHEQLPEGVEEGWEVVNRKKGKNSKPTSTAAAPPATEEPAPVPTPASSLSPFIVNFNCPRPTRRELYGKPHLPKRR